MLGGDAVDQRRRLVPVGDDDDGAIRLPARPRDVGARQARQMALDRRLDRRGETGVVGDQDRLRGAVVLGLRQQIGGDPCRVVAGDRRRPGFPTGRRSCRCRRGRRRAAWPPRHRRCPARRSCRPARSSRCRRRAPPPPAPRRPGRFRRCRASCGGGEHERVQHAARRRHGHHQPLDAGDLGRDRVHQHRGGIGRGAARHVEPDRVDRPPARAEPHPQRVDVIDLGRQLPAVKALDPLGREPQRRDRVGAARRPRPRRFRGGDRRSAVVGEIDLVEAAACSRTARRRRGARRRRRSPRPRRRHRLRSRALPRRSRANAAAKPGSRVDKVSGISGLPRPRRGSARPSRRPPRGGSSAPGD